MPNDKTSRDYVSVNNKFLQIGWFIKFANQELQIATIRDTGYKIVLTFTTRGEFEAELCKNRSSLISKGY